MFVVHCFVDLQGHFKPLHIDLLIQKAIKRYIQNPHFGNLTDLLLTVLIIIVLIVGYFGFHNYILVYNTWKDDVPNTVWYIK